MKKKCNGPILTDNFFVFFFSDRKYKYSPERLKKSASCQSEEFSNSRQGRRQSGRFPLLVLVLTYLLSDTLQFYIVGLLLHLSTEPSKEILKNTEGKSPSVHSVLTLSKDIFL